MLVRSSSRLVARSAALRPLATRSRLARSGGVDDRPSNEPGGFLFGERPLPAGQKRVKEEWESIYMWGMGLTIGLAFAGAYYKPDTNITSWARAEAQKRFEEAGDKLEYTQTPRAF
ncbi:hypothetical protein GQ42DRAFT_159992 [Ramicandelaber brevisporus]|nr:hypothetical protein GQ42DRAFT_159992 [Ramicandelaber brevisporus]